MSMNAEQKNLICRVLVPKKESDIPSISTGYAIKQGIVMLSRHALLHPERDDEQAIVLRWDSILDEQGKPFEQHISKQQEHYSADDDQFDIAFVECPTPPQTPDQLSYLERESFPADMKWEAVGYPKSKQEKEEVDYEYTTVGGETRSSNTNGVIELDSTTNMKPAENWQGISGAPIFSTNHLIGVIVEMSEPHEHRLEGISLAKAIKEVGRFSDLLGLKLEQPKYIEAALKIIKNRSIFDILYTVVPKLEVKAEEIYQALIEKKPVGDFLELMDEFQQKNPRYIAELSRLAYELLPHFIDEVIVKQIGERVEKEIVLTPYSNPISIEMLMAKMDQRAIAIDAFTNEIFTARFALPISPEGADEETEVQDMTADLFQSIAGCHHSMNLMRTQTKALLQRKGANLILRRLKDYEQVKLVKMHLERNERDKKPRYYLICKHADFENEAVARNFYESFKNLYPQCAVIKPSEDFGQICQEDNDYYRLQSVLHPCLTAKPKD